MSALEEITVPPLRMSWGDWISKLFGPAQAISCSPPISPEQLQDRIATGGPYRVTRCCFIVRGRAWTFILAGDLNLLAAYNVGADPVICDPHPLVQQRLASMTASQREVSLINDAPLPWRYVATGTTVTELARTIQ